MPKTIEVVLLNRPAEIARLQDQLEALARERGFSTKVLHDLQIAVEEHLTNILNHAFSDQQEHQIKVRLLPGDAEICVEVEDDGRPFNPLEHPAPDLSLPLAQRPI